MGGCMGEIDIRTNKYMRNNDHFADVFNFFLFGGRPVIRPEQLQEMDRSSVAIPYGKAAEKSVAFEKSRDVIKTLVAKSDEQTSYLLLGVENQSHIHYAMPVRNMLYDAISYTNQVDAVRAKNRNQHFGDDGGAEFLSGLRKGDKLHPVITLVIYWSADAWEGPVSLHEMLDTDDVNILRFVPDYRLNILAPESIADSDFEKFSTALAEVFQYIKKSNNKADLDRLLQENSNFRHMDRESAELINTVTKSNIQFEHGKETVDMCTAIQQMREESMSEGMEKGMENTSFVLKKLYDSGRTDDMQRAMTDKDYLDRLIKEFCGK